MPRRRLVVLTHSHQGLDANAGIARMAEYFWRPDGWEVLVHQGLGSPPDADLALLHVDLTVVPSAYLALAARYPYCINGRTADISKRVVSRDLLDRDADYAGPVIVKTDRNVGGQRERDLALALGGWKARLRESVTRRLPAAWTGRLKQDRYLPFPSLRAVPGWVWRHPELVVERFLEQREGPLYAINQWQFLGDQGCVLTYFSTEPMVKYMNQVKQLPLHDRVPEAIRVRREELGFDYGKFDFLVTPDGARLLDANRTPWTPRPASDLRLVTMARGLESLLRRAAQSRT